MLDFEGLCSEAVGGEGRVGLRCGGQSCVAGVAGLDDHELLAGLSVALGTTDAEQEEVYVGIVDCVPRVSWFVLLCSVLPRGRSIKSTNSGPM